MWEVALNKRVLFGNGKINETPEIIKHYNIKKTFIIAYDANSQVLCGLKTLLDKSGIKFFIYDNVKKEPDLHVIDEGARLLIDENCDGVLGIGGGSVLDTAKVIAMLANNGGTIEEYQMGQKSITRTTLPLILIPTTSGTGSEATKVSVIYNNNNGLKKSVYSPYMIADIVILDPQVTVNLPSNLTASTGMDALSHAIESYVSLNANDMTEMYSLKALELINRSITKAVNCGDDINARGDMILASYLAGCALHAGIGIAHIIAQPIGGVYKIPHGDLCSIFLPLSMEANLEYSLKKYRKIAEKLGVEDKNLDDFDAANLGIERVKEIRAQVFAPQSISSFIQASSFNMKNTLENIKKATGHIKCNPRPIDEKLLSEIIEKAF